MLNKTELDNLLREDLTEQLEELKERYEYLMLQLLNGQIDEITKNYYTAKAMITTIESMDNIEKALTKEKEEGEKENGKTKLNA